MASFLLFFLTGHRNQLPAVVGNCLQEVSPLCSALLAFLLPVNKLFYSLSGPGERRRGEGGGEVLWGHGER